MTDDPLRVAFLELVETLLADRERLRVERDRALAEVASLRRVVKQLNQPMEVQEMNFEKIIQAWSDSVSAQMQRERAETQMTLGSLIATLEAMPAGAVVAYLYSPHSYRGYYCDLALKRGDEMRPAKDLLKECRTAMGKVFPGYKGGEFVMHARTPVWIAEWGESSGERLMGVYSNGQISTSSEEI